MQRLVVNCCGYDTLFPAQYSVGDAEPWRYIICLRPVHFLCLEKNNLSFLEYGQLGSMAWVLLVMEGMVSALYIRDRVIVP